MANRFDLVAPVLPVRSVRAALERYRRLGFDGKAYGESVGDEPIYGFLERDQVHLHLARVADVKCDENTSACYVYVADADALHAAWKAAGVEGRLTDPEDTPYHLREFAYVDPDGNLLRIGSEMKG